MQLYTHVLITFVFKLCRPFYLKISVTEKGQEVKVVLSSQKRLQGKIMCLVT